VKGKDHELEAIRDFELVQDRGDVVANRCLADEQTLGQIHVARAGADVRDDFALTPCQRINLPLDLPVPTLT